MAEPSYEGWAIVECLGHRVLSGRVQAVPLLGGQALRIDVALPEGEPPFTEFLMPAAVYGIVPVLQEDAERWAAGNLEVLRGLGLREYRAWTEAISPAPESMFARPVRITFGPDGSEPRDWTPFVNPAAYP